MTDRVCLLVSLIFACVSTCLAQDDAMLAEGRKLFTREWIPTEARAPGGDGLGPMFNETSCVACHNEGGVGGGGSVSKNIQLLSAFSTSGSLGSGQSSVVGAVVSLLGSRKAPREQPMSLSVEEKEKLKEERDKLGRIHPGFRSARSVVLHRFSTDATYSDLRGKLTGLSTLTTITSIGELGALIGDQSGNQSSHSGLTANEREELNGLKLQTQIGTLQVTGAGVQLEGITLIVSERNPAPLFGSGELDSVPDSVLVAAAARRYEEYPEVSGRVAMLRDGRIGRFGWKAQKARLSEFVLAACAIELGLDVPGEPQSTIPNKPEYQGQGLDISQQQCDCLIAFVRNLPAPRLRTVVDDADRGYLEKGRVLFESTGCATCHTPQLGDLKGVYTDLLLHDMGIDLSDSGNYNTIAPNATEAEELDQLLPTLSARHESIESTDVNKLIGATRQEWRTPPLWGLRDSGPYLHDGRAATIEQAIALHGGEGTRAAQNFIRLSHPGRLQLVLFLRSLIVLE